MDSKKFTLNEIKAMTIELVVKYGEAIVTGGNASALISGIKGNLEKLIRMAESEKIVITLVEGMNLQARQNMVCMELKRTAEDTSESLMDRALFFSVITAAISEELIKLNEEMLIRAEEGINEQINL